LIAGAWKLPAAAVLLAMLIMGASARADLVVSLGATANVACGSGTCTATAKNAVLNVGTLQSMLASGNVTVTTGTMTNRLVIHAPLTWSSKNTLSLHGQQQVAIEALIVVRGFGGMALSTGDGTGLGNLAYAAPGRVAFKHPLSTLTINGLSYKLVTNIAGLAAAASANANAYIALADDYDATPDGTYGAPPVLAFNGLFEGLGNTISNLTVAIADTTYDHVGLFGSMGKGCSRCGRINGIALVSASITGDAEDFVGGLVGSLDADISQSSVNGVVRSGTFTTVGGLVGTASADALVVQSHADARVSGPDDAVVGGLIGENQGTIFETYALGDVPGRGVSMIGGLVGLNKGTIRASFAGGSPSTHGQGSIVGGLVGESSGTIENCYTTGAVTNIIYRVGDSANSNVGGLVGLSNAAISTSYATGAVSSNDPRDKIGGFVGFDGFGGMNHDYWDTDTSGITKPSAGAGNIANDPGITGLTTAQLTAKLPVGFSPAIWARNPKINSGLPYLIATPPPS
jgi:hypothetical protein